MGQDCPPQGDPYVPGVDQGVPVHRARSRDEVAFKNIWREAVRGVYGDDVEERRTLVVAIECDNARVQIIRIEWIGVKLVYASPVDDF